MAVISWCPATGTTHISWCPATGITHIWCPATGITHISCCPATGITHIYWCPATGITDIYGYPDTGNTHLLAVLRRPTTYRACHGALHYLGLKSPVTASPRRPQPCVSPPPPPPSPTCWGGERVAHSTPQFESIDVWLCVCVCMGWW